MCSRYQQRTRSLGPLSRPLLQYSLAGQCARAGHILEAALFEATDGIIRVDSLSLPTDAVNEPRIQPPPQSR